MIDYQFLGLVAAVLAVVTRGRLLPVVMVTAVVGLAIAAGEWGARAYRRRHPQASPRRARAMGASAPSNAELKRWMSAVERILDSTD